MFVICFFFVDLYFVYNFLGSRIISKLIDWFKKTVRDIRKSLKIIQKQPLPPKLDVRKLFSIFKTIHIKTPCERNFLFILRKLNVRAFFSFLFAHFPLHHNTTSRLFSELFHFQFLLFYFPIAKHHHSRRF